MKLEVLTREPGGGGAGGRTPLLFVHGSCHAAWCWDEHFLDYFARRGRAAHAVSLRGHGASEGLGGIRKASVGDYVRDLERVAAGLGRPPIVVGHSLGGLVVQKYLERHRAPAGVLVAPSPASGMLGPGFILSLKHPLLFAEMYLKRDVCVLYSTPARARAMLFSADIDEGKLERYAARVGAESFRACMEMIYNLPRPRRVKSPVLVLGGADDHIIRPRHIESTARAYGGDMKIFPRMAHDMMLEDGWEGVARHMLEWLNKKAL